MAYFIPSSIQKRLLRYALSRLELLDTDALDLDSLDIAWSKRSTVELKDVGLRIEKLRSLLQLPRTVLLKSARISRLLVTVPADIYSSSIVVEVEGVTAHVVVPYQNESAKEEPYASWNTSQPNRQPHARREGPDLGSMPVFGDLHNPESSSYSPDREDEHLPTPHDLAKSFLQEEPKENREELEAAISNQSQILQHSTSSTGSSDDDVSAGLAPAFALPSFLANFLRDVGDRLQIKVSHVTFDVDVEIMSDERPIDHMSTTISTTTLRLSIKEVEVHKTEGMPPESPASAEKDQSQDSRKCTYRVGRRCVSLIGIEGSLISDSSTFPTVSETFDKKGSNILSEISIPRNGSDRSAGEQDDSIEASVLSSEAGKYADAAEEESVADMSGSDDDFPVHQVASCVLPDAAPSSSQTLLHDSQGVMISRGQEEFLRSGQLTDPNPHRDRLESSNEFGRSLHGSLEAFRRERNTSANQSVWNRGRLTQRRGQVLYDPNQVSRLSPDSLEREVLEEGEQTPRRLGDSLKADEGDLIDAQRPHSPAEGDELLMSREFSHEEAQSLYMSVLTEESSQSHGRLRIPGSWDDSNTSASNSYPEETHFVNEERFQSGPLSDNTVVASQNRLPISATLARNESTLTQPATRNGPAVDANLTQSKSLDVSPNKVRASLTGPEHGSPVVSDGTSMQSRPIFIVDEASLWFQDVGTQSGTTSGDAIDNKSAGSGNSTIPGAFSQYGEPSLFERQESFPSKNKVGRTFSAASTNTLAKSSDVFDIELLVGSVRCQVDLTTSKALTQLIQRCSSVFSQDLSSKRTKAAQENLQDGRFQRFRFYVLNLTISVLESLPAIVLDAPTAAPVSNTLFKAQAGSLDLQSTTGASASTNFSLARFVFGFADQNILSFSKSAPIRTSIRDLQEALHHDISVGVSRSEKGLEIFIATLPIYLNIDIQKLDETLSYFGGFSGLLELGSSITSAGTATQRSPRSPKGGRTVRFHAPDEPKVELVSSPITRINARFGGARLELQGKNCSVRYQSTAIKLVRRDTLIAARIDEIHLSGPCTTNAMETAPIRINIQGTLLNFLPVPEEHDLSRLLSLLTPSKDKFEEDDDILIGTLLRQRKKGSVLRVSMSNAKIDVDELHSVTALQNMAGEMARLSAVTKYLPEDDRPGIMTLGSIGALMMTIHAGHRIEQLNLQLKGIELGHVGFPPLMALAIQSIYMDRNRDQVMIREVLQRSDGNSPPMIMARMIGDELEPTAKIKLFNVCLEYSVPLIMSLFDLSPDSTTIDTVVDLSMSIATMTAASPKPSRSNTESEDGPGALKTKSKPLLLDVALRDCAIGLTPQEQPSKGLLVLTDVTYTGATPSDSGLNVRLELRKVNLLVVNDRMMLAADAGAIAPSTRPQTINSSPQVPQLCRQGFVSVGSISAAKAQIKQAKNSRNHDASMDVEFKDALFVLETCADSTQTLGAILEGLKLPSPPSMGQEFRTEVMPIQDLMASVLEDAFGTQPDAEQNAEVIEPVGFGEETLDDEGLPTNSELLQALSEEEPSDGPDPLIDSVLFQIQSQSATQVDFATGSSNIYTTRIGTDATEEFEVITDDLCIEPISLSQFGTAHRWDSKTNRYLHVESEEISQCPLKLKLRSLHIIWNLFDGYDWEETRETIAEAVKDIEAKAAERRSNKRRSLTEEENKESVIGDFLFNSIYIGVPANREHHDLRREINYNVNDLESETGSYASSATQRPSSASRTSGPNRQKLRLTRSKRHKITFELRRVTSDVFVFKPGQETQASIDFSINDFEIFDHVPTSSWKKFMTYMHDAGERQDEKPMIHLEICNVRPVPELTASELVIKAQVLPVRLHVDQDALDFITRFFEFSDSKEPRAASPDGQPYLQRVEVEPVQMKLDYKPKKVDYAGLRSGHTTEFMNFFILDGADILLKHAIVYGVRGFTRLHKDLEGIWMPDIKRNQLPRVLSGLTGVRSLVDVGTSLKDMIEIPIQEYRKDGRVLKSIQRGAVAFGKTTSELTRLGAKLAIGAQTTLQGAEDLLVGPDPYENAGWEVADLDEGEKRATSHYADQPSGIMQGLRGAALGLRRDALLTRDTIVAMSSGVRESSSATDAAGAIAKHAPTIIFRPVIGASRAISQTLLGATNTLDPQNLRRFDDKYKRY